MNQQEDRAEAAITVEGDSAVLNCGAVLPGIKSRSVPDLKSKELEQDDPGHRAGHRTALF